MKALSILCLLMSLSLFSFGQFASKVWTLSQGVTFRQTKSRPLDTSGPATQTVSTFELIPNVGYFVFINSLVGLGIGYYQDKTEFDGFFDFETTTNGLIINPYLRYYLPTNAEELSLFIDGAYSLRTGTSETITGSTPGTEVKRSEWSIKLSPGLNYFVSNRVALEIGFRGIQYRKEDPDKDTSSNEITELEIGLNSILPSQIGFRLFLR